MRRNLTDIDSLKALAHPLRQQMFTHLNRFGPATSADLAARFEADRGATSYHLRQLERFGFIEEDTDRSAGRRRYWKPIPLDLRLPFESDDPAIAAAADAIGRRWMDQAQQDLHTFLADPQSFGAFGEAAMHSNSTTTLTAEELARFTEEYVAFMSRWHRYPAEASDGARLITVLFNAFPTPS
ncbi:ArsR/SmtB family transcription factor [Actinoplanes xinjiangensis]|jgi:DNA-binding MarR family transcriptional regulator|uniref:ArsR family transcriptional regulator n=1 Tax=Actinoplanes xinjiangensis TaxID=512350 RepID=A0A316FMF5_9ACTN|nr:helix-turn-helix domain-containing protein [Actinoplanes xinjiangensis]PWK48900.1 ArsR family transcriptional regulator [Actinoplanes xinjiangensis]GIF38607.1 transcriptional regulator [Actinoplanes xinjiangensis]